MQSETADFDSEPPPNELDELDETYASSFILAHSLFFTQKHVVIHKTGST